MANYIMVQGNLTRILKWRGEEQLLCFRCSERIQVGDRIHRNNSGGCQRAVYPSKYSHRKRVRFYHAECYEEMFVAL